MTALKNIRWETGRNAGNYSRILAMRFTRPLYSTSLLDLYKAFKKPLAFWR